MFSGKKIQMKDDRVTVCYRINSSFVLFLLSVLCVCERDV